MHKVLFSEMTLDTCLLLLKLLQPGMYQAQQAELRVNFDMRPLVVALMRAA
jgi:hypothetical protein